MHIKDSILGYIIGDTLGLNTKYDSFDNLFSSNSSFVLATIDSILYCNKIDYQDICRKYLDIINFSKYTANNEILDLGNTTLKAIMKFNEYNYLTCGDLSIYSNGNGALARILPIALFMKSKKDSELKNEIITFTGLTHKHEISLLGCYIMSKYIQFITEGKSKETSFKLIKELNYETFSEETLTCYKKIFNNEFLLNKPTSTGYIVDTIECILYIILTSNSFQKTLENAIRLGGDVNTNASLACAIACLIYNVNTSEYKIAKSKSINKISILFEELIEQKHFK